MTELPALLDAHALLLPAAGVAAALLGGIHVALSGGLPRTGWLGPTLCALPSLVRTTLNIRRGALTRALRLPPARSNRARTRLDPSWLPSQAPPRRRRIARGYVPPDHDASPRRSRHRPSGPPGHG